MRGRQYEESDAPPRHIYRAQRFQRLVVPTTRWRTRRARGGAVLLTDVDPARVDTTGITGGGRVPPPTGRRDRDGPRYVRKSHNRSVERACAPAWASARVTTSLDFDPERTAMTARSPATTTAVASDLAAESFAV